MKEHLSQIREKLSKQRNSHVEQRDYEKKFLDQIAELERVDIQRRSHSKKKAVDEYKRKNLDLISQLKDRDNSNKRANKKERYSFFPFMGSDNVENKRL